MISHLWISMEKQNIVSKFLSFFFFVILFICLVFSLFLFLFVFSFCCFCFLFFITLEEMGYSDVQYIT